MGILLGQEHDLGVIFWLVAPTGFEPVA
jgi:hypothetical protein